MTRMRGRGATTRRAGFVTGLPPLPKGTEAAAGNVLNFLASYRRWALAEYLKATLPFEAALSAYDAVGRTHPGTATIICNLSLLFEGQGDFTNADPLFWRALAIREEAVGPNPSRTGKQSQLRRRSAREGGLSKRAVPEDVVRFISEPSRHICGYDSTIPAMTRKWVETRNARVAERRGPKVYAPQSICK
jgi:Tetratricopeptide repeat